MPSSVRRLALAARIGRGPRRMVDQKLYCVRDPFLQQTHSYQNRIQGGVRGRQRQR
jgi:hypothetical protein